MKKLLDKYRLFLSVGMVGAIGAAVQAVLLTIFVEVFHLYAVVSNIIAAELVILLNFTLNNVWTFKHHTGKSFWVRLVTFNTVVLGSLIAQTACMWIGVHYISPKYYLLYMAIGIGAGWVMNYFFYTKLIWFKKKVKSTDLP